MHVLSIDLPWSTEGGQYGFAWVDLSAPKRAILSKAIAAPANQAASVFQTLAKELPPFDVILVDQPIGPTATATLTCRDVERAFMSSSYVRNGTYRFPAPTFQPGGSHMLAGLANARTARAALGRDETVVVESFPQLSVPTLIEYAHTHKLPITAISSIGAHKQSGQARTLAAMQLLGALTHRLGCTVSGPAAQLEPNALDAAIGLLPIVELLSPSRGDAHAVVWLHATPPGGPPLPSSVRGKNARRATRAQWMSALTHGKIGAGGVRVDGILAPQLPGWPAAAQVGRVL